MMSSTPVPGLVGALAAMRDRPDSTPLLPELAGLPTLVVVGEEDELTPPDIARALAAAIPGARLVTVPGGGHLPPVERPVETTRALLEFLAPCAETVCADRALISMAGRSGAHGPRSASILPTNGPARARGHAVRFRGRSSLSAAA